MFSYSEIKHENKNTISFQALSFETQRNSILQQFHSPFSIRRNSILKFHHRSIYKIV